MENYLVKGHMGQTIKFLSEKDRLLFMNDFLSNSYMMENFNKWNIVDNFNIENISFKESLIEELIEKKIADKNLLKQHNFELESLHKCLIGNDKDKLDSTEQNNVSINFYEISESLKAQYIALVKNYISKLFSEKIYYQEVPTFRFHFPHQKGYEWEDRYHSDIMLGHPPYELNVWIPLTSVYGSNSMRLTSLEDSMNFISHDNYDFELFVKNVQYDNNIIDELKEKSNPLELKYGQYVIFDPRCLHCTQNNLTDITRISMDIRIITESNLKKYSRDYRTTGRKKMFFLPGYYFSKESV